MTALRPIWKLCSPAWLTQPMTTSSTAAGSMPERSTRALSTSPAMSAGCQPESLPPRRPPAVRRTSTMNASAMDASPSRGVGLLADVRAVDLAHDPPPLLRAVQHEVVGEVPRRNLARDL